MAWGVSETSSLLWLGNKCYDKAWYLQCTSHTRRTENYLAVNADTDHYSLTAVIPNMDIWLTCTLQKTTETLPDVVIRIIDTMDLRNKFTSK